MTRTDFSARLGGSPLRLNLGCGNDYRDGYLNVDMNAGHRVDLTCDVTALHPIADNSCAEALAQDILEHIQRARAPTALREWNRVLRPGGRLTLRVPSLRHLLTLLGDPKRQSPDEQRILIQNLYGTQGYEGDFHFNGYTEVTLRDDLAAAGFEVATVSIIDNWLLHVNAVKVRHTSPDSLLLIESDGEFLREAYRKLLGRPPDDGGVDYYLSVIQRGCARESVLESLKSSSEYQSRMTSHGQR